MIGILNLFVTTNQDIVLVAIERDCKRSHYSGASELLYYVVILFLFELAIGRKIGYSTKHIKNNVFDLTKVFS